MIRLNNFIYSFCFLFAINISAQTITKLTTEDERMSYALGLALAQNFESQGLDKYLNIEVFKQAVSDKLEAKELLFPKDSVDIFMTSYMPKVQKRIAGENLEAGKRFLEENKKKEGVKITASGLQYKVEEEGIGDKPKDGETTTVHYILKTIDGMVIQDSKKINNNQPLDLLLENGAVIPGWKEGVELMSKGAKYTLYIPQELAYGTQGGGHVGGNTVLIFDIELLDIKPALEGATNQLEYDDNEYVEYVEEDENRNDDENVMEDKEVHFDR